MNAFRTVLVETVMLLMGGTAIAQGTTTGVKVCGSVFGGGNNADVKINTTVNISTGQVNGNVYGGGNLGDVGTHEQIDGDNPGNYNWINQENSPNTTDNANNKNTGVCIVNITGGTIGSNSTPEAEHGNVFGGGKGTGDNTFWCQYGMVYSTNVSITNGMVRSNVFGGGEVGRVETDAVVKIGDGVGVAPGSAPTSAPEIKGDVFGAGKGLKTHGYSALVRGNVTLTIEGNAQVRGSAYGGGEIASVGRHKVKTANGTPPTPPDAPADLPVGMPYTLDGTNVGECTVNVQGYAEITNNVFGAGQGVGAADYVYDSSFEHMGMSGMETLSEADYLTYLQTLALTTDTDVNIDGHAKIMGSVYGGSENGFVQYDTDVSIQGSCEIGTSSSTTEGNVYGGGRGISGNTIAGPVSGNTTVTIAGGTTWGSVFGGGAYGVVKESVAVNVTGGEVKNDVYGGGALADTQKSNWDDTANSGAGDWAAGKTSASNTTTVRLTGGTIVGAAYGGGLGQKNGVNNATTDVEAIVYGDVIVDLNGTTTMSNGKATTNGTASATTSKGCIVNQIFGCNNINGTPKGDVMVHVFGTQNVDKDAIATKITYPEQGTQTAREYLGTLVAAAEKSSGVWLTGTNATTLNAAKATYENTAAEDAEINAAIVNVKAELDGVYDVYAIYGGGNNAAYVPVTPNTATGDTPNGSRAQVVIEGCDYTSIQYVYGGGNAAPVPDTYVLVKGTKIIDYVFGGGNGTVSAADVGYDGAGGTQGNGNANTTLIAGTIHNVYGASNTNGDIRGKANIIKTDKGTDTGCCDNLVVNKMYAAGKDADISGGSKTILGCMPEDKIEEYYGGAENANVLGDVELTITSGKFGKVFGGNKTSGAIFGHIFVNIEETGCRPIEIEELYGCGNDAPYSVYGFYDTGNTNPNNGKKIFAPRTSATDGHTPVHTDGTPYTSEETFAPYASPVVNIISCTSIGKVFGGGLGANAIVYGNPTVNINQVYGISSTNYNEKATTLGAIGDVYGGGNEANVVGNTTVNVCTLSSVEMNTEPVLLGTLNTDYTYDSEKKKYLVPVVGANITDNVFGAGKGVPDDVTKAMVTGKCTVNMANGTVKKSVYGGGELSQVDGDTEITVSGGTIGTPKEGTTVYGGATYGNIYGGGMGNTTTPDAGLIKGNTKITIQNTVVDANTTITPTILHNIYGGGAYGSVGTITRGAASYVPGRTTDITNMPTAWVRKSGTTGSDTGTAEIYINGGVIGTDGNENGMVFGSSRGDVTTPEGADADHPYGTDVDPNDRLAWVYDTKVVIGQSGSPDIRGSVYGSGENGHVFKDTDVQIHNGKVGVDGTGKITDPVTNIEYTGADYPKRGNVYGGGCGEDDYSITSGTTTTKYFNPLAGIVLGDTKVTIDGGKVVHNVYGAGALGSVGSASLTTGGKTVIEISGGQVGDDGVGDGNVYGAARGKQNITQTNVALVRETSVTISSTGNVKASVYGGGEAGNVRENAAVSMTGGSVGVNIYGGGNLGYVGTFDIATNPDTGSKEYNFKDIEGNPNTLDNSDNKNTGVCTVTISGGKVGPDDNTDSQKGNVFGAGKGSSETFECEPAMVYSTNVIINDGTVNGTVYGGGEVGRVENNTVLTIGTEGETGETNKPDIKGNVFAAGKGLNTHGYSALVRGDSKVTVQGIAHVGHSVYGGGEIATVGRYVVVDNLPTTNTSGGDCTVDIQDNANISGSVYGAGKGVLPYEGYTSSETPWSKTSTGTTQYTDANKDAYFKYITTLAIASDTHVTVKGSATVGGSVYGGGQKGFVQTDTDVKIQESCTIGTTTAEGNVFGGGLGDASVAGFAEAGRVKGNTNLTVSGGNVYGNVYGGGSLGDVGTIVKSADYNYKWTNETNPGETYTYNNTGLCTVEINGGIIGVENPAKASEHGNVFGAGKGKDDTYWCEKAMVYKTNVTINKGTVYGNVYGGGQIGRVENNAVVTIGPVSGDDVADIKGNVFGAGAGLDTHGYSALVRGNATVTVQGKAQVGQSVYGGGETASVGRFVVNTETSLPTEPLSGGTCTVTVNGEAAITGNVYGACKGITPDYANATNHWKNDNNPHGFDDEADYLKFLKTLALTSNTDVTIGGGATIGGDVYGGGQRGITLGYVEVDVTGGTITKDVYGGGALADTNTSNWDGSSLTAKYYEVVGLTAGTSDVTGLYTKDGSTYTAATGTAVDGTTYYRLTNTMVRLTGGTINGAAYGGGLGDANTPAYVYGDVTVKLNENKTADDKGCIVGKVFGCNNLNGTPKGHVQVYVYATQNKNASYTTIGSNKTESDRHDGFETLTGEQTTTYDVEAVYGGGNLSPYEPVDAYLEDNATNKEKIEAAQTEVYILGCDLTSIKYVYGGGNAASAPATYVRVDGAYEIEELFAGGNGKDNYVIDGKYYVNPGANVGYTNYTELDGTGDGSKGNPYNCKEKDNAKTKANRQTASNGYMYGSGIAHLEAFGGYVHAAYGGSNEKGNIRYQAWSKYEEAGDCGLRVLETYGGGKNSEIDGEIKLELGCTTYMPEIFGGSKNADVNSDIELNIANGRYDNVFGGNNTSGNIYGSITVNIKENGCVPINITNLYLGGYLAGYSIYGYYQDASDGNKWKPRTKEQYDDLEDKSGITVRKNPRINVISATRIDNIFGGGYKATVVGDPHINVNMEKGRVEVSKKEKAATDDGSYAFEEDDKTYVYKDGGKNLYHQEQVSLNTEDNKYYAILPIGTIGNVYGGGNEADIIGDTYVEIGTGTCHDENGDLVAITPARNAATITGDVFGGGKGVADSFLCDKAMVGVIDKGFGSTHVTIENGTVNGNVYGGGQIGRVEHDTSVTIGKESDETNNPVVKGDVFGAGKGLKTHGYSALVRGKATVTVQGKAKVEGSVYGGGEIASVGRYNVKKGQNNPEGAPDWVPVGMPYSLYDETSESGNCIVVVRDNAIIGPETPMLMKKTTGVPDDTGHVFGAGKGVLPYEGYGVTDDDWISVPWRMAPDNSIDKYSETDYVMKEDGLDYKAAYLQFIETLALATETNVTISGNAFVKGSVYGGSMNGHVQHHTNVTIAGGQIGAGDGMTEPYKATDWTGDTTPAGGWKECAHWDYVDNGAPYDPLATTDGKYDYTKYSFVPTDDRLTSSEGGLPTATDGHTYYGNVFGGGSGVIPYAPGLWHRASGSVGGNSNVTITGGHILTSVYGGNEQTDVGTYAKSNPTEPATGGKCTITMSGGTVGVPLEHKENYPVTGHLFGAGKGDKRILFNTWTNVAETEVSVSGGTIYGNVYGGGEDGHVMGLAKTTISEADAITNPTIIGTTGASGFDGDVFGGGQGSVTALTAGVVGGNVNLSIEGGTMMGSVYGGGRLASVGTFFALATDSGYGEMQDGDDHGNIKVNLMGGTINQNVFGGCMGSTSDNRLGVSKDVTVNLNGYETTTGTTTTTTIVADDKKGCVVKGSIFGCNNLESSPQGDVLVHVYGTQKDGATQIANTKASGETPAVEDAKTSGTKDAKGDYVLSSFDVQAVYGGGNMAAYVPTDLTNGKTQVVIDGCGRTSIGQVYGGGNAASAPATEVTVNGSFEIAEVFGGGNGKDKITINNEVKDNPGANVGFYDYSAVETTYDTKEKRQQDAFTSKYVYGSGKAAVNIYGGTIHRVFGGSNTKGNVRLSAITLLEEAGGCDFCVDEAYGGGKSAPMDAEAKLLMACIPGLTEVYGGAQAADVYDNVTVTVTNGTFKRVFGGNNLSGTIRGKITVNVEETGCKPVIIGELYGGGNQAAYSVYGYKQMKESEAENAKLVWMPRESDTDNTHDGEIDAPTIPYAAPQVNVKSFTSIGNIYGGGYGEDAVMVGNPIVNVNVAEGAWKDYVGDASRYDEEGYPYKANGYQGESLTITDADGKSHDVAVPAHEKGKIGVISNVFGGGNAAKVIGSTNVNIGTEVGNDVYMEVVVPKSATSVAGYYTRSGAGTTESPYSYTEASGTPADDTSYYKKYTITGADIRGNVYGGGNNAEVTGNTNVTIGKKEE